ncbi:MAG: hypothetical protein DIU72_007490 [Pseudomonadota bacterium]|nr:MAG: hypothetical protein DIU72_03530 [Pseudomonadota bacterium]
MSRKRRQGKKESSARELDRIYEGIDILDALLVEAGAEVDGKGAIARLAAAIAERRPASEVIPSLFPTEPRFASSEYARRLYGNLFGVWDLLLAGRSPEDLARARTPAPAPAREEFAFDQEGPPRYRLPPRGSVSGDVVPFEVVEGTWQMLQSLPEKELKRRLDRYENTLSELAAWPDLLEGLSDEARDALDQLCFELAQMFDQAFGDRFGEVRLVDLETADPDQAERLQPYAVDFLEEALDEEEEEEGGLASSERRAVAAAGRRAIVAMTRAVRQA